MSDLRPTERFGNRVDDYVRYRPSYPEDLLSALLQKTSFAGKDVADVGSGTGIFSGLLAGLGGRVTAIEPNDAMRAAAESRLQGVPGYRSRKGTSEAIPLPDQSVDLITAAQAFHWFDRSLTKVEFQRVLRPAGWVALVWNERQVEGSPFLLEYEQFLRERCEGYQAADHRNVTEGHLRDFMAPHAMEVLSFPSKQRLNQPEFEGRVMSSSYSPSRDSSHAPQFLSALSSLFSRHEQDGVVELSYLSQLYLSQWQP